MDPHRSTRSLSLTRCSLGRRHDRCLIMILQRSIPKAIQLGPPFSALGCHHASPSERYILDHGYDSVMDLDDQDYMFDDRWFHVTCSSDLSHFWCHTGAYFRFDWDLQVFIELHAHPHLRDTHRDDDPPVESLSSYPVRSALFGTYMSSCFLSGHAFLICGSDSVMDSGDQGCIVDDWWFDVSWSFGLVVHLMPYWGILPFRMRFMDFHGGHVLDDRWFYDTCSSDLTCTRCPYWGIFSISDVIYGSSLMSHVRR